MKRFAGFLGVLMILILLAGCATSSAPPPDPTDGIQGQQSEETVTPVVIEKMETFHVIATHTDHGVRPPEHMLHITFFKVRDEIIGAVKCEHGLQIVDGEDASNLRNNLIQSAKKEKTDQPGENAAPGHRHRKPNDTSVYQDGAGRMWPSLDDPATRFAGNRQS